MHYRLAEIDVPDSDPFQNDRLSRKDSVESVANFLDGVSGPFVLAINSPWGTGKTTFIRMLRSVVAARHRTTVLLNAWTNDFAADPLVAFVGEIQQALQSRAPKGAASIEKLKKISTYLARRSLPIAGRLLTAGLIDVQKAEEEIGNEVAAAAGEFSEIAITDAIDEYTAEKAVIERFHSLLTSLVEEVSRSDGKDESLIVFVDELDRCRPSFAVEVLEHIKHLFNVKNVVFVLSVDRKQLGVSLRSIYGAGLDSDEYLRRFIDLEFKIPQPDTKRFTAALFDRYQLRDRFEQRQKYSELQFDFGNLQEMFAELFDVFELSLRAQEQCVSRLAVAMSITAENVHIFPFLFSTLVVLKERLPDVFDRYVAGGTVQEVVEAIMAFPKGPALFEERTGHLIRANLIVGKVGPYEDPDSELRYFKELSHDDEARRDAPFADQETAALIERIQSRMNAPSTKHVLERIEMAYRFDR